MAAHGVAEPGEGDGLGDVAADGDEVDGHVARADGDGLLREEDHVADGGDKDAEDGEGVAVAEAVGAEGCEERDDGGGDVDGNGVDLGANGGPAELLEDGRGEEGGAVSGVDDAEVHDSPVGIRVSCNPSIKNA